MKIFIEHSSTDVDYKNGAITLRSTDNNSSFELGVLFQKLVSEGKEVTYCNENGNVFIRIPLTNKEIL